MKRDIFLQPKTAWNFVTTMFIKKQRPFNPYLTLNNVRAHAQMHINTLTYTGQSVSTRYKNLSLCFSLDESSTLKNYVSYIFYIYIKVLYLRWFILQITVIYLMYLFDLFIWFILCIQEKWSPWDCVTIGYIRYCCKLRNHSSPSILV